MLSQYIKRRSINSCTNEHFLSIFLFIITVLYVALYMITNVTIYVVIKIQTKDKVGLSAYRCCALWWFHGITVFQIWAKMGTVLFVLKTWFSAEFFPE